MKLIQSSIDTPWKVWNEIWRRFASPYVRIIFKFNGIQWGEGWRIYGVPNIQKQCHSKMQFGSGLQLRSSVRSNPLGSNHPVILCTWQSGALLEVGANFSMTGGTLCAAQNITIGGNVAVGANTIIVDTDFHPTLSEDRKSKPDAGEIAPIVIEDNVFIGMNCLILKGVTIGSGTVIGAGSVGTTDIPSQVIAAGNPARTVRKL